MVEEEGKLVLLIFKDKSLKEAVMAVIPRSQAVGQPPFTHSGFGSIIVILRGTAYSRVIFPVLISVTNQPW